MPTDARKHERLNITEGVNSNDAKAIKGRDVSLGGKMAGTIRQRISYRIGIYKHCCC